MNGSNTYLDDDTFNLVTNGMSSLLLPYEDANAPSDVIAYRTVDERFWKVWAYYTTQYGEQRINKWEVWDKTGTKYTFGDQPLSNYLGSNIDERAQYLICKEGDHEDALQFWKWPLVHIGKNGDSSGSFDAELNFFYQDDYKPTRCTEGWTQENIDLAIYPLEIRYSHNRYRVIFNKTADRQDYDDEWEEETSLVLYEESRLNNIKVQRYNGSSWQDVREYDFKYADDASIDPIYKDLSWPAGGQNADFGGDPGNRSE
jgi:hypothetical protein